MAIDLTPEELEIIFQYVARRLRDDGVPIGNVGAVIKWMILNPLPTRKQLLSEQAEAIEKEKERRIKVLTAELERLEGN